MEQPDVRISPLSAISTLLVVDRNLRNLRETFGQVLDNPWSKVALQLKLIHTFQRSVTSVPEIIRQDFFCHLGLHGYPVESFSAWERSCWTNGR